jgi:5-methyltetrahydrofolate--homocysteine methyltransferase
MTPASNVSGLLFAHPESPYFTVGRIGRDQVQDLRGAAARTSVGSRGPWCAYQPDPVASGA